MQLSTLSLRTSSLIFISYLLLHTNMTVAQSSAAETKSSPDAAKDSALGHEPTNDAEVQMQNKYLDKIKPEEYQKWIAYVKSRPAEEQVWLRTLEDQLGSFYAPPYMRDLIAGKVDPEKDGWAYVKDDPSLPRVLIIGDSISRSYTASVRRRLKGKANVHRAPANCSRTENFFKNGEVWLNQNESNQWDIVTFNFGIHDAAKPSEQYAENLKKIIARLKETGAKILWVRTTPWRKPEDQGTDLSVKVNTVADAIAKEEGFEIIDINTPVLGREAELHMKDGVHFNDAGTELLGEIVANALQSFLPKP